MKFISKAELARQLGVSRETLRKKLKKVEGLHTGRRQLLYPYEVRMVYEAFGVVYSSIFFAIINLSLFLI